MLGLLIHPIVLMLLVWIVTRDQLDSDYPTMFFVCFGVGLAGAIANHYLGIWGLLPYAALTIVCVMYFGGTTLGQAAGITVAFIIYQIGWLLLWSWLLA